MPTVALVVIGDEILSGKFPDDNGPWLIHRLRALGADLRRVVVIPDVVDTIAAEVRACSDAVDLVLTSGGVGPTHDDRTVEAVAAAFELTMDERPELLALLARYDIPVTRANRRMAAAPSGAELLFSNGLHFPVLKVRNVFVLPGVPRLFRAKFESVAERFTGARVHTARMYTDERETEIATRLAGADARHPDVAIGSYPRHGRNLGYRVIVTLESRDAEALARAVGDVASVIHGVEPADA